MKKSGNRPNITEIHVLTKTFTKTSLPSLLFYTLHFASFFPPRVNGGFH